jgi:hypothetical protein
MKKHYIVFLVLCLASSQASAQVRLGLKAGVNYSDAKAYTYYGEKIDVTGGTGFHAGAQMRVLFDETITFLPQLQYAYKSFTVNYNNGDTGSVRMNYHYLELPILLEYNPHTNGRGFFVQFGPSFSLALGGNEEVSGKANSVTSQPINFAFSAYGRFEANLVANVGYQFSPTMQCTIGYAHGLGSIVDDDFGPQITPRMFTASLHYWMPEKKK